jgi:hypothetical protein
MVFLKTIWDVGVNGRNRFAGSNPSSRTTFNLVEINLGLKISVKNHFSSKNGPIKIN